MPFPREVKTRTKKTRAKMRLGDLDYGLLREIVQLYDKVVGGWGSKHLNPRHLESILKTFRNGHAVEWRFGSKTTVHSKLWID